MDVDVLLALMDEPETRGTLPSGINPWVRQPYDPTAKNPIKVAGGRKSQQTTKERHGMVDKVCENPRCNKTFQVSRWREQAQFTCSSACRDRAGRMRRAGLLPPRPHAAQIAESQIWRRTETWKKAHPEETE